MQAAEASGLSRSWHYACSESERHIVARVSRHTAGPNFKVEVRRSRVACTAHRTDQATFTDRLPARDVNATQVAVERHERPMRDHDGVAITPIAPPGEND